MAIPYTVALVVDPAFGDELRELTARVHAWVVDTPQNRSALEKVWAAASSPQEYSIESGTTTFTQRGMDPEENCISVIDELDLHHNIYSHNPGYTALEVYGANPSRAIREAFQEHGFVHFEPTPYGFVARKDEP